ncbi:hypothetical protein BD410DRAFT_782654 [Rickenella mellea]|uniref:RlpA-like protein double-psi beta-barrel domain-containing protein n=1 Tax=Rickenella mellea TaxID=50990 RepID=A0A4Y7QJZ0_9AGAM|nr:hypothetical protein BD410DRAFT_782654 [Rickenella mellea]
MARWATQSLFLFFTSSLFWSLTSASHARDGQLVRRHHARAASEPAAASSNFTLDRRGGGDRFTYYQTGMGACGQYNNPGDFIVALNIEQWDGGSHCFKMITINCNGKSTQAQIMDECPGCPYGGLDMSQGLFSFFADTSEGVIYGDWSYGSGAPPPPPPPAPKPKPPPPPPPAPKHTEAPPPPKPSTTWTPPPHTSTKSKLVATTSWTKTHSTTSTTSSATPASTDIAATESGSPAISQNDAPGQQIMNLANTAVIDLAAMIGAGARASQN